MCSLWGTNWSFVHIMYINVSFRRVSPVKNFSWQQIKKRGLPFLRSHLFNFLDLLSSENTVTDLIWPQNIKRVRERKCPILCLVVLCMEREIEESIVEWYCRMEIKVRPRRKFRNMWKGSKKSFVEDSISDNPWTALCWRYIATVWNIWGISSDEIASKRVWVTESKSARMAWRQNTKYLIPM